MKKLVGKILLIMLTLAIVLVSVACSSVDFTETKYKNWGAVEENGGFLAQTENYVYFINGIGSSTSDNTYGVPVKGSLMVAPKTDLTKAEVAVPKLFTATDYNAGLFIDGSGNNTFVYYGTPNLDKNSSGDIANNEMTFMRTRLDGSDSETFFSVNSHSCEYRFVKAKNGAVLLFYYDSESSAIKCYDTKNDSFKTIVKTDKKANESLDAYKFIPTEIGSDVVFAYTTTVYAEPYNDQVSNRLTENYNKLYIYSINSGKADLFLDGALTESKFEFIAISGDYIFYKETLANSNENFFAVYLKNGSSQVVENTNYATESTLIVDLDNAYVAEDDRIYRISFNDGSKEVAADVSATSLIAVDGDYIYYVNGSNKIARITLDDETAVEERVSESSVTVTWYAPEFFEISENKYLAYNDGKYNYFIKVNVDATMEEDGDEKIYYLEGETLLGKKIAKDAADDVAALINAIKIDYDEKENTVSSETLEKAKTAYDKLSGAEKDSLSSSAVDKLNNYKKALELSEKLAKLKGVENYDDAESSVKTDFENYYNDAKNYIAKLSNADTVRALCNNNLNWYYQQAQEKIDK